MKKQLLAAASALLVLGAMTPAMIVLAPTEAHAAKQKVGEKVGKPLAEAQKLATAKDFSGAIAKAKEADAVAGKTAYEDFVVKDYLTFLYVQSRNYGAAAGAAEAALATGQAPKEDTARRVKLLAQLYYQSKNSPKTIEFAERYLANHGYDESLAELIAQSYFIQKNYGKALSSSLNIVNAADKAGRTPSETSLQLALSSAYSLKDKPQTKEMLFRLASAYPKQDYYTDLFNTLLATPGNTERVNLEIFRAQIAKGMLTDPEEILEVGQTAIQLGLPGEAQRIIDKAFADGKLGAGPEANRHKRLQKLARDTATADKASLPAQIKAAKASASGQDDVVIGEAAETYGETQQALELVQGGIAKGGLKNADEAKITLGRIQYALGQKDAAIATFKSIADPKLKDVGRIWSIVARQG